MVIPTNPFHVEPSSSANHIGIDINGGGGSHGVGACGNVNVNHHFDNGASVNVHAGGCVNAPTNGPVTFGNPNVGVGVSIPIPW